MNVPMYIYLDALAVNKIKSSSVGIFPILKQNKKTCFPQNRKYVAWSPQLT